MWKLLLKTVKIYFWPLVRRTVELMIRRYLLGTIKKMLAFGIGVAVIAVVAFIITNWR
jgi:hypothetical protein